MPAIPDIAVNWNSLWEKINSGDQHALARTISLIENEFPGYDEFLKKLGNPSGARIIGITGPPGAGKSTIADTLIGEWAGIGNKVAVICVDPSSPFHFGALLGDRLRMNQWYNHPSVFIRSLSSRGSLGGLNPHIIEIADLLKAAGYERILIETVGVGQNEVDIAGLAETTVVVLVPASGDDIQAMKSGILETADIFVINKSDLPQADELARYILTRTMSANPNGEEPPVIVKTIATEKQGIPELYVQINLHLEKFNDSNQKIDLLTEKAWRLILQKKMREVNKTQLKEKILKEERAGKFNLYQFISDI
jgi:LAO/AO transport system kinase